MRVAGAALASAALALALWACGGESDGLSGTSWRLVSLGPAGFPEPALFGARVSAEFPGPGGEIRGSGGCNAYFGTYEAGGGAFEIAELAFTERWCEEPEGVGEQEARFYEILGAVTSASVAGVRLTLGAPGDMVLIFRRAEE